MRELSEKEVEQVSGGLRSLGIGLAINLIYDGIRTSGRAIADHYDKSDVAFRDDPAGRGRALL